MPELRGDRFERVLRYAEDRAAEISASEACRSSYIEAHLREWARSCVLIKGTNTLEMKMPTEVIYDSGRPVGVRVDV